MLDVVAMSGEALAMLNIRADVVFAIRVGLTL